VSIARTLLATFMFLTINGSPSTLSEDAGISLSSVNDCKWCVEMRKTSSKRLLHIPIIRFDLMFLVFDRFWSPWSL